MDYSKAPHREELVHETYTSHKRIGEVRELNEKAGISCGEEISVLKHQLSRDLELVGQESSAVAAALSTFRQLFYYIEQQVLSSEAASKQALNSLRGEVGTLHEDYVQVANQCKSAQSGQDAQTQRLNKKLDKAKAANQQTLRTMHGILTRNGTSV
jgi:hypothetical protein